MSRHNAAATEGEMDRLMLAAPTTGPTMTIITVDCGDPGRDPGDEDDSDADGPRAGHRIRRAGPPRVLKPFGRVTRSVRPGVYVERDHDPVQGSPIECDAAGDPEMPW